MILNCLIIRAQQYEKFNYLPAGQISSIFINKNAEKWIGTINEGLWKIIDTVAIKYKLPNGFEEMEITTIAVDNREDIWIGTSDGFVLKVDKNPAIQTSPSSVKKVRGEDGKGKDYIQCMCFDSKSYFWIGTACSGLKIRRADGNPIDTLSKGTTLEEKRLIKILKDFSGIRINDIEITEDSLRTIFIASEKGLYIFDSKYEQKERLFKNYEVTSILINENKSIWLTGYQILNNNKTLFCELPIRKKSKIEYYSFGTDTLQKLKELIIKKDSIYMVSNNDFLITYNMKANGQTKLNTQFKNDFISCLAYSKTESKIYIGTYNDGLYSEKKVDENLKVLHTTKSKIRIYLCDTQRGDSDAVSIELNKVIIIKKFTYINNGSEITSKDTSFDVNLNIGLNLLTLNALSAGNSKSDNTFKLIIDTYATGKVDNLKFCLDAEDDIDKGILTAVKPKINEPKMIEIFRDN